MLMSLWAWERKGEARETGEKWRGGDLVQVFNSHFKNHMERISMYIGWKSFISMSGGEFLQICTGEMNVWGKTCLTHTHTHTFTYMHSCLCYWQGQSEWRDSRSPKAQGSYRLQLRCVCAPATPQCVSACALRARWMEMAAPGVILSPFPKEEGEMCHACYPSRHRFLWWNIGKERGGNATRKDIRATR